MKEHCNKKMFLNLLILMKNYSKYLNLSLGIVLIILVISIVQPIVWANFVADLFQMKFEGIYRHFLFIGLVLSAIVVFNALSRIVSAKLNVLISSDLKYKLFNKVINFKSVTFDKFSNGELLSRIESDSDIISRFIINNLLNIISDILKVLFFSIAILIIDIKLSLICLIGNSISFIIYKKYGNKIRNVTKILKGRQDNSYGFMVNRLSGFREIVNLGIRKNVIGEFKILNKERYESEYNVEKIGAISEFVVTVISMMISISIYIVGIGVLKANQVSVEEFFVFCSYSSQLGFTINKLARVNLSYQKSMVSLERIVNLLNNFGESSEKYLIEKVNSYNIDIKKLSFAYDANKILDDISLEIREGERIIFFGESGSGKSTLAKLISRFNESNKGELLIGDKNINEYSEESFRKNVQFVSQNLFLFNKSILENITFGNINVDTKRIDGIIKQLGLGDFINTLPEGMHTIIGNGGIDLSEGQKQRVVFARSVLRDAKIYIFDEVASALDSLSANNIFQVINEIDKKTTVIIITHKISDITRYDKIVFFENKKISVIDKYRTDEIIS